MRADGSDDEESNDDGAPAAPTAPSKRARARSRCVFCEEQSSIEGLVFVQMLQADLLLLAG